MRETLALCIWIITGCVLTLNAQDQNRTAPATRFYVTSVGHAEDATGCESHLCNAITYRVEGYVENQRNGRVVELVLTCSEHIVTKPVPHRLDVCARLHAGKSYLIDLQSETVSFLFSRLNRAFEVDYKIESEKETRGTAATQMSSAE